MTMFSVMPSLFLHPFNILYLFLSFLLTVCHQTLWTHQKLEHWVAAMLMSCCSALVFVFTEAVLQRSCYSCWSLSLIVIRTCFDVIFLFPPLNEWEARGGKRGRVGEKMKVKRKLKKETAPHLMCVFSSCLLHILQIETLRNDAMMSIWLSTGCFQVYFCLSRNRRDSKISRSHNPAPTLDTSHASSVNDLTC